MLWVATESIKTDETLSGLYPIEDEVLASVTQSMIEHDYDESVPMIVWGADNIVIDGHTRLAAARAAPVPRVYVQRLQFADLDEALEEAIKRQRERRNMTKQQQQAFNARSVQRLDQRKRAGRKSASAEADYMGPVRSAEETAAKVGTSKTTVERIRRVLDENQEDEDLKRKVLDGKVAPTTAEALIKERAGKPRRDKRAEAAKAREGDSKSKPKKAESKPRDIPEPNWAEIKIQERRQRIAVFVSSMATDELGDPSELAINYPRNRWDQVAPYLTRAQKWLETFSNTWMDNNR